MYCFAGCQLSREGFNAQKNIVEGIFQIFLNTMVLRKRKRNIFPNPTQKLFENVKISANFRPIFCQFIHQTWHQRCYTKRTLGDKRSFVTNIVFQKVIFFSQRERARTFSFTWLDSNRKTHIGLLKWRRTCSSFCFSHF